MVRHWTQEETCYLQDHYGVLTLATLSAQMNRSEAAIKNKVVRLKIGRWYHNLEGITLNELANALGIWYTTANNWYKNYGLPAKLKRFDKDYFHVVKIEEFWRWAEKHKNMIEWDKCEKHILGAEPEWVDEARKAKVLERDRSKKKTAWSKDEDEKLLWMLKQHKFTYPQISEELGRTHGAVKRRMRDLNIKLRPIYLDNTKPYSEEEIVTILDMYKKGYCFKVIAAKLDRSEAGVRGKVERMGYTFKNRVLEKKEVKV
ncbi:MAG: hypothetical protein ACLTXM_18665 [Enterococcus sp.]